MILARLITSESYGDLEVAFLRLGLPTSAREYLFAKLPRMSVLLTGLERVHGRFLRGLAEQEEAPGHERFPSFVSGDQGRRPGTALLMGRRDQLERLAKEARANADVAGLGEALERALRSLEAPAPLTLGARTFSFDAGTPYLMGIVNATPDSFSDGGRYAGTDAAVAHGMALVEAGADLLDIGGESTRPGAPEVSVAEEIRRVVPVIEGLRERTDVPLSIDTRKSEVAQAAVNAGATLVNDVSGLSFDPRLAEVVAETGAALCVMHMRGTPETMQREAQYEDVVDEVLAILASSLAQAIRAGVPRERLLVDPGIGFAKTGGHNLFLLRRLADFRLLEVPVLVGFSRKAFLGALTGGKPAAERVGATAAAAAAVTMGGGADFLRVHDVAEVREAVTVARAIRAALEGGQAFSSRG